MRKILIPYFLAGNGHLLAARAIAHYLKQKKPDWHTRFLEPADEFGDPMLHRFYIRAWKTALEKPLLSKSIHRVFGEIFPSVSLRFNKRAIKNAVPKAIDVLQQYKPDLIMTTHWGCGHIFHAAREETGYQIPLFCVRNELSGAYRVQDCRADFFFVTSERAKQDFIKIGVPDEKLITINFLGIPECFEKKMTKEEARKKIGIPGDTFTILFTAGGEGIGFRYLFDFIDIFLRETRISKVKSCCIIVTGRNQKLYEQLKSAYLMPEVITLGYEEDMHIVKSASDIIAGKCGAIYSMEAAVLHKPFIITLIGAPNERFNKEYIVNNGFGWYTPKPSDFASLLKNIFKDRTLIEEKIQASSDIPLRNGAEDIADKIISITEKRTSPFP